MNMLRRRSERSKAKPADGLTLSAGLLYYDCFEAVTVRLKELPHNTAAHLTVPFPPYASCKFLDLPPVSLRNLQVRLAKNSLVS